jgi:hypothetical protein
MFHLVKNSVGNSAETKFQSNKGQDGVNGAVAKLSSPFTGRISLLSERGHSCPLWRCREPKGGQECPRSKSAKVAMVDKSEMRPRSPLADQFDDLRHRLLRFDRD